MKKRPEIVGSVELDVHGREVFWLKFASYSSIESCESECRRFNGEVNDEEGAYVDDIPDADSLELLLQRDSECFQEISAVYPLIVRA